MGANQSITDVPVNITDAFELVEYNQDKDKVKICNNYEEESKIIHFSPFSSKENSGGEEQKNDDEHSSYTDSYEQEEALGSLHTDNIPDFKEENRRKREKKIYRKRNKFILRYALYDIDKEVEIGLQQIIHMKSFNELENYLRSFILHNRSVRTVDHRKN